MKTKLKEIEKLFETRFGKFISLSIIVMAIVIIPYLALIFIQNSTSDSVAFYVCIVIDFLLLIGLLIAISRKNFYDHPIISRKISTSLYAPLMIIISTGGLTIICFGALTSALYDSAIIHLEPSPEHHHLNIITDFFLWHALDLIPALDINETFNSKVPFTYNQLGVKWLLLVFKVIIAWVIIKQNYDWIKWVDKKKNPIKIKSRFHMIIRNKRYR